MAEKEFIVKAESETDPLIGKKPKDRSVEELIKNGVVCIDKPMGPTSHQVSAWVKDIVKVGKAGHTGTLDPRVTGVLPVALENATKAVDAILLGGKEYVGVMQVHRDVPAKKISDVTSQFVGEIYQTPPVRAAVKRQLRTRKIYEIDILEISGRTVLFKVKCESGTYIRVLCNDIGEAMGTGAHLAELRRTATASFTESDTVTLQELQDRFIWWKENNDEKIREVIFPMEKLLDHLPKIIVKDSAVDAVCHGANLAIPGISRFQKGIKTGDIVALMTLKGEGIAMGRVLMDGNLILNRNEGFVVDITRVLMDTGVYPRAWKKRS